MWSFETKINLCARSCTNCSNYTFLPSLLCQNVWGIPSNTDMVFPNRRFSAVCNGSLGRSRDCRKPAEKPAQKPAGKLPQIHRSPPLSHFWEREEDVCRRRQCMIYKRIRKLGYFERILLIVIVLGSLFFIAFICHFPLRWERQLNMRDTVQITAKVRQKQNHFPFFFYKNCFFCKYSQPFFNFLDGSRWRKCWWTTRMAVSSNR